MKDFKDFYTLLSPCEIENILKSCATNGKIGIAENVLVFIEILKKYHDWLNA